MQTDHITDGAELAASAALAAQPRYLGDVAFVTRWLRQFASRVLYRFEACASGSSTKPQAVEEDVAEIQKAATIFLGEEHGYTPMPDWNGKPLADYIRLHLAPMPAADDRTALQHAFHVFMLKLYASIGRAVANEMDDEGLQAEVVSHVDQFAWLLAGMERHGA